MDQLYQVLRVGQLVVYGGLGLLAVLQWWRGRTAATAWIALTFGTLGTVITASWFAPDGPDRPDAFMKALVAGLVLFPYFLYRFARTLAGGSRWTYWVANALTAGLLAATFAVDIPSGDEPRSPGFNFYLIIFVLNWVGLTGYVTVRLWRNGRRQPPVARTRMRLLAVGGFGMIAALLIAAFAPASPDVRAEDLVGQLLALVSGPLFLLGFSPPAMIRAWWRQWSARHVLPTEMALMRATTPGEVGAIILPEASDLMGGQGALLVARDGSVLGRFGLREEDAEVLASRALSGDQGSDLLTVALENGVLAVQTSAFTPYFGRDETELLGRIAALADLAMTRTVLMERERVATDRLREAQALAQIGSWEWDVTSGEVVWSEEMCRIYGYEPGEVHPTLDLALEHSHPEDRDHISGLIEAVLEQHHEVASAEYRIVLSDGQEKFIQARGRSELDDDGAVLRMQGTAQDITARKREEVLRDRFIANAAHELRTPLTSLLGFAQLLSQGERLPQEHLEPARDAMERAGDRLRTLVDNLLDLTKLQQGTLEVALEEVHVPSTLDDVLSTTPPPTGWEVRRRSSGDVVALTNRHRLEQILVNLLTNAYRYGGKTIDVTVETTAGVVTIAVADDGGGVEPGLVPHLFDPFTRGPTASEAGGSGLGLAIAASTASAIGGSLSYRPATGWSGARFVVELPAAG